MLIKLFKRILNRPRYRIMESRYARSCERFYVEKRVLGVFWIQSLGSERWYLYNLDYCRYHIKERLDWENHLATHKTRLVEAK